ncbi:glycosyltransferase family 2 protein [candidate division KSB1 bacterium]|nr:glycosyltransferase family 2 protein [candidate division KSB1 bacterium]
MDIPFFKPFIDYFEFAVGYISHLTLWRLVEMFWFFLLLDLPRYILPDFFILYNEWFHSNPMLNKPMPDHELPFISVIVPARNEEETIGLTINSLLESNFPANKMEIIVVDDGSEDRTFRIAQAYSARGNVRVFKKSIRGGKASCLVYGLKAAKGAFIMSVDSDSTFDRDALRNILKPFRNPKVGAVSGNVKVRNRAHNLLTRLQYCEYMTGISLGRRWLAYVNMLTIVSGAFGCFRRSVLEASGAWDPGIGDDSNVTLKTRKLGFRVGFAPDAIVMTNAPTTLKGLFKQRRRWNRSFIRNRLRKHKSIMNPLQFNIINLFAVIIPFFYRVVLLFTFFIYIIYTLLLDIKFYPIIFFLTWVLYSCSTLFSLTVSISFSERRREEWKILWYVPLMPFYRLYIRFARLYAYIQEIFRLQYEEPFYPDKVWSQAPRW